MYDISRDGQEFLLIREERDAGSNPIVVVNWVEELKAKLGTSRDCDEIVMGPTTPAGFSRDSLEILDCRF